MTVGLRELQPAELTLELENVAVPLLVEQLRSRAAGHCMRVTDLDTELMVRLCARLRAELPKMTVVVLTDGKLAMPAELSVTSTKVVELRNPLPDGTQRPPLLVFVPNDVRASAEDSFGVATFEQVSLGGLYEQLHQHLLKELPPAIRGAVQESLRRLRHSDRPWPFADALSTSRFLLTAKVNGNDPEAVGASLYELGLVPDFEWLAHPESAPQRMVRNRECVEKLTWSARSERGRVRELGLAKQAFRNQLGDYLAETGTDDPRHWNRRIVHDRALWPLAFNKWEFEDGGAEPDSIFIGDVQTDLPTVDEDETKEPLVQLLGQRVLPLGEGGLRRFSVTFRVDPLPTRVQGLAKFVAQVISKDHGPIGLARRKAVWKTSSDKATISFSSLNRIDWEEGWHFVRVLAQTEGGDLIPLVDDSGNTVAWSAESEVPLPRPNESDLFYVLPDTEVDIEPAQRAVPREASAIHALFRAQFTAVLDDRDPATVVFSHAAWADKRPKGRAAGADMLEVKLGREGTVHVPVSRALKSIEQKILAAPDGPISWRIPLNMGVPGQSTGETIGWPEGPAGDRFIEARTRYFAAVRGGTSELVTQGVDAGAYSDLARDYAAAYLSLLGDLSRRAEATAKSDSRQALADLRKVLGLDSVLLAIVDHRGRRRDAVLVAPTHPLRALWFATWTKLGARWVAAARTAPREYAVPTRDALLRLLAPTNFPPVLPTEAGHVLTAVDSINPFWTLFAPSNEEDPRGLVGEVCTALGLPEPAIGGALIDGAYLASRVRRYLVQHPYVRTLTINAFNAGRAAVLGEMLLELQKDPVFAQLRYDIRLFVPDPDAPGVGEEIAALLTTDGGTTAREADAFSTPAENHLHPKLRVAVRSTQDFRTNPEGHAAHLSLLFDVFPAEEVAARRADPRHSTAFVHGLVQEFSTEYHEDELTVAWRRLPRHGVAQPIEAAEDLSSVLGTLSATISSATAAVATGQSGLDLRPVVSLALGPDDRALLHQVHEVSDWVFTLDRNLGIEFFDHGGHPTRPDYLIDHSPDMANALGHRLVITSRSVAELEALLRPVLEQYGLSAEGRHAVVLLDQLRSLSGRLALKLISSPTQRAEALGLALSRLYLEHQGVFENQIVLPLDAHIELYRVLKSQADELGDEVSFKRTDLGLFDLNAVQRTITCRLVEVKCYSGVGDLTAYNALKAGIAEQIAQSERVLAHHFDPHRTTQDRPDRAFKTREFAMLLEFYLERAERYGAISRGAAEEARFFLHTLDEGYRFTFTRSALIFDFATPGTEPPENEGGIEYHRIGVDLIRQLVEAAAPSTDSSASTSSSSGGPEAPPPRGLAEVRRRRERASSVPTLDAAAFLGSPRDRSVSWEDLRDRHSTIPPAGSDEAEEAPARQGDQQVTTPRSSTDAAPSVRDPSSPLAALQVPTLVRAGLTESEAPAAVSLAAPQPVSPSLAYDIMLGVTSDSPQYGLLGDVSGRRVAIDLNQTHTISLFGVQGGGKSYTLGTIAEMASLPIPQVNVLPKPLATVIFHYSPTMDYRPEFTTMVTPNSEAAQIKQLRDTYGAEPRGLEDVVLLVPADKLDARKAEYPGIDVYPLKFGAAELQASHWRLLMGAVGNQATYIRQLNRVIKSLRNDLSLEGLRAGIEAASLPEHLKELAKVRLDLAAEYIDDHAHLSALVRPGRLIIVDVRDEFIEKDEAFGLFFVLLQLIAGVTHEGEKYNKLFVFDEAHKYMESVDLVEELVRFVREMRHGAFSILVASQDPLSVPPRVIELSDMLVMHRFNSPAWLKYIQKANAALTSLTPEKMANLKPGEAFVWSSKATDEAFSRGAVKVRCRPRVTQHGGATKTAV
ncbi:methylation-associated defense system ATP-binding protein MAD8 [Polyangium aurulentum]|uniref:methylation-associated defense system ATP-binding protein MAD8 n=1 Tax=Polyangium aurulentum TaxID=2567896 RepID=UPI0010ADFC9B|nr:ATP-binding protein [Polyangium aurulentum]UQA57109.1 ATP-binding protein [Polyangium aurulentum]